MRRSAQRGTQKRSGVSPSQRIATHPKRSEQEQEPTDSEQRKNRPGRIKCTRGDAVLGTIRAVGIRHAFDDSTDYDERMDRQPQSRPGGSSLLSLRLRFRDDARLGPGKIALLEAIARTGSVAEAGKSLDMSERRALLLIDSLTSLFGEPIVINDGSTGTMRVSELGLDLIVAFRAVEADAKSAFARHFAGLTERLKEANAKG